MIHFTVYAAPNYLNLRQSGMIYPIIRLKMFGIIKIWL